MVDPGTPENPQDKRFIPAFISFTAAGIFSVAISQLVYGEYPSGIALTVLYCFL
jgi:hypothetical protein